MSRITDVSDRIARFTDGNANTHFWTKFTNWTGVANVVGSASSLWMQAGKPGPGSPPGASSIPTRATPGAMAFINPGAGRQKWLMTIGVGSHVQGVVTLYDRLWHCGGLVTSTLAVQTPAVLPLTRYTNGVGNRIYIEVYAGTSVTPMTATVVYVNQAGVTRTAAGLGFCGAAATTCLKMDPSSIIQVPLLDGDTGVRSVTSIAVSPTDGGVTNFGLTIAHPLYELAVIGSSTSSPNGCAAVLEDIEIPTDACLSMFLHRTGTCVMAQGFYILGEK